MSNNYNFALPQQAVATKSPDFNSPKLRLNLLRTMMKGKQKISVKFYVSRAGVPSVLFESHKTAQFKMDLTKDIYESTFTYLQNGQVISEDADCETPISFVGDTADLQESILRQCVLSKMQPQWLPPFLQRNGLMTCTLNLWMGSVRLSVKRSDKLVLFLHENGHNV